MSTDPKLEKVPGHWLLAGMGKRVLRPGGRELTDTLLDELRISPDDQVVELAHGMGATTRLILERQPSSYVGVERDEVAANHVSRLVAEREGYQCVLGTAQASGLEDGAATVVCGEAFLTMQSEENRRRIVDEAYRLLRPGGRYGMHELCLRPDTLDPDRQERVQDDLSRAIHVGARPLVAGDWRTLLEEAGFEISRQATAPMHLLEPRRLVQDEGPARAAKIVFNVVRTPAARARVRTMRATFRRNADNLGAIALVATKPEP